MTSSEGTNYFFVVLPSTVKDYPDNRPNKYRVHLPQPLQLYGGTWLCALYSIQYPHSWASTLGTTQQQWVQIHYMDGSRSRVLIPKTSQRTAEELQRFLTNVLGQAEAAGRRQHIKRQAQLPAPVHQDQRQLGEFFSLHPDDYWSYIEEERTQHAELKRRIELKRAETAGERDLKRKRKLMEELFDLQDDSGTKQQRIELLSREARRRDADRAGNNERVIREFFSTYPDNYNEKLAEERLNLTRMLWDLQAKNAKYAAAGQNLSAIRTLNAETNALRAQIANQRMNLDLLLNEAIQRNEQKTREQYEEQAWRDQQTYVRQFFEQYPNNFWQHIHQNFEGLQRQYRANRERRERLALVRDEDERKKLQQEIDGAQTLIDYRRKRYSALEYEARRRDALRPPSQEQQQQQPEAKTNEKEVKEEEEEEEARKEEQGRTAGELLVDVITGRDDDEEEKVDGEQKIEKEGQVKPTTTTTTTTIEKTKDVERARTAGEVLVDTILGKSAEVVQDRDDDDDDDDKELPVKQQSKTFGDVVLDAVTAGSDAEKQVDGGEQKQQQQTDQSRTTGTGAKETKEENTEERTFGEVLVDVITGRNGEEEKKKAEHEEEEEPRTFGQVLVDEIILGKGHDTFVGGVHFVYQQDIARFAVRFSDSRIRHVALSEQLGYVLGFPDRHQVRDGEVARYGADLTGGFTSFSVYVNGLTRSVIMGNSLSSLLRIVAVEGNYGQYIERVFDSPMYLPCLPREIHELEVELRMSTGDLVPFDYGSVLVTLVFKRVFTI